MSGLERRQQAPQHPPQRVLVEGVHRGARLAQRGVELQWLERARLRQEQLGMRGRLSDFEYASPYC